MKNPRYSICMSNYNMAQTLEESVISIVDQLDEEYEIVIVDDGSTDESVTIIKKLQNSYSSIRLIVLDEDKHRKLGETRNIAFNHAKGEYVLMQIDCDDVYQPYIRDFVEIYHQIRSCNNDLVYLKGININIGEKRRLAKYGPYRNIFRGEDREMWRRLAADNAIQWIDHGKISVRSSRSHSRNSIIKLYYMWDQMRGEFRTGILLKGYIKDIWSMKNDISVFQIILRFFLHIPAWLISQFDPISSDLSVAQKRQNWLYNKKLSERGTFERLMNRRGCNPDWDRLSDSCIRVFENN
jgi:glycosyltransferase involved in cell wall biosynthesis